MPKLPGVLGYDAPAISTYDLNEMLQQGNALRPKPRGFRLNSADLINQQYGPLAYDDPNATAFAADQKQKLEAQRGQPGILSKLLIGGAANALEAAGLPGIMDPDNAVRGQTWGNALKATAWAPQDMIEGVGQAVTAPARAYRGEIPDEDMIAEGLNFGGTMAMGGSVVPKPTNAAGMFGGRLAKTADHAKLQTAEKMAAEGAPREAIWRDTGWFQGVDGKWRFEIDDSGAAMKYPSGDVAGSVAKTMGVEGKMGDVFHHPKTYFAYPDVAAIDADIGMLRNGTYYAAPGPGGEKISVNAHHGERVPYTLHELQHSLQEREGFAKGGSIAGLRDSLQGKVPDEWLTDKNLKAAYRRMAGEVEARAVERRSSLTPLQRQDRAPWLDYDVPESQQIVRFNSNPTESAAPGVVMAEAARQPVEVPFYRGSGHGQTSVDYSQPYWGTSDKYLASDYAKSRSEMYFRDGTTPNVVPAMGRFRNPLIVDAENNGWSQIPFEGGKISSGAEMAGSLDAALALCAGVSRVFVIGGAELYALALPQADELVLTEIDAELDGDVFFPDWPRERFALAASEPHVSDSGIGYRFNHYIRQEAN